MIRVTRHPGGMRVHILGLRIHHGLVGACLVVIGFALLVHDIHDAPWGFA